MDAEPTTRGGADGWAAHRQRGWAVAGRSADNEGWRSRWAERRQRRWRSRWAESRQRGWCGGWTERRQRRLARSTGRAQKTRGERSLARAPTAERKRSQPHQHIPSAHGREEPSHQDPGDSAPGSGGRLPKRSRRNDFAHTAVLHIVNIPRNNDVPGHLRRLAQTLNIAEQTLLVVGNGHR